MNTHTYWKFTGITSLHVFSYKLLLPVLAVYFASLGFSESWISFVFAIFSFVVLISAVVIGELSDEIGRSWTVRVALVITVFAYLLYWFGAGWSIVFGRVLDALSYTTLSVVLIAKVEDALDRSSRARFTGVYLTLRDFAKLIAPLAGGFLADQWIGAPFLTAIVFLLGASLLLRDSSAHKKKTISIHPIKSLQEFFRNAYLRPFLFFGPALNGVIPALAIFVPLIIVSEMGLSYTAVGVAVSVSSLALLFQFFIGDLADRYGLRFFLLFGSLCMPLVIVLLGFVTSYYWLLALLFLYGVGLASWNTSCIAYISEIATRSHSEGQVMGSYMTIGHAGEAFSYVVVGLIMLFFGYQMVFFVLGGVAFVVCAYANVLLVKSGVY